MFFPPPSYITSNLPSLSEDEVRKHFKVFREEFERAHKSNYWKVSKNDKVVDAERVVAPYVFGFLRYCTTRLGSRKTGIYALDNARDVWKVIEQLGCAQVGAERTRFTYFLGGMVESGSLAVLSSPSGSSVDFDFSMDSEIF